MWTPKRAFDRVRPKLVDLLAEAKADCGCMMQAVKVVAGRVGASEHWVRRIIGRYGEVKIQAHHLINVVREHVRLRRKRKKTGQIWPAAPAEFSPLRTNPRHASAHATLEN